MKNSYYKDEYFRITDVYKNGWVEVEIRASQHDKFKTYLFTLDSIKAMFKASTGKENLNENTANI